MRTRYAIAVGVLGFTALACAPDSDAVRPPTQPSPTIAEPRPGPPPAPQPGARRIEVGALTSDVLRNWPVPAGCPVLNAYPDMLMPCSHFEVVAPGDGILGVEVVFTPNDGAEGVGLIVAGINQDNRANFYAPVGTHRVVAGATYGITVVYQPSHYDYVFLGPELIGTLTLKSSFEVRTWALTN